MASIEQEILAHLDRIEERLVQRRFLYDHPSEYGTGVAAAIAAVREEWQRLVPESRAG